MGEIQELAGRREGSGPLRGAPSPLLADFTRLREAIDRRLGELVPSAEQRPQSLNGAIRHALLAPSKRVRPVLAYLVAAPDEASHAAVLDAACALEMVHTASLILDDLPCMDDAALRRQRPTTHVAFGEATAILAAIALMNCAYGILADIDALPAETRSRLSAIMARAIGCEGLVAGQELDLNFRDGLDRDAVEDVNWLKTGVLFVASAEFGAVIAGLGPRETAAIGRYARHLGLAFQTADDLLDQTAAAADIGKDVGKDGGKPTLVSMLGVERARLSFEEHLAQADAALVESGVSPEPMRALVSRIFAAKGIVTP
ncbi:polyprenyl synthetase family protein [Arsenicitalea aurantiaca]|uniref:Probable farnesyl diphosphate synthase n=1 Tax=Arsenicitalea aurantiaca TaxID=1783274 RepID=A0A433XFP7_9HYPH|nr:polyprenyl synthetase family protein [Arsenicitalea aurantiaca]RUT32768.1 polyprenyl synthetase family protein [Arsenicitalea aurantiaca]